jgi:hypothetical protein
MELIIIGGTLAASLAGAIFVQKAVLEALLRTMFHQ